MQREHSVVTRFRFRVTQVKMMHEFDLKETLSFRVHDKLGSIVVKSGRERGEATCHVLKFADNKQVRFR